MGKEIGVGIIGTKFMGRAHSHAYIDVAHFFDVPLRPVLRAACGRNERDLAAFAERFGWQSTETSWERLVTREDIGLVDISTPNSSHAPIAMAAAKAGKHILCEKPMALNATQARQMLEAARTARVRHMLGFNYRRVPAIALARQMIEQGRVGTIRHVNAVYLQDWLVDPKAEMTWREDAQEAGSGAHGDLNAHIIDLARYLVGEFQAVCGAQEVFVKERPRSGEMARVTVDDATGFLARFRDGALGSFLSTRFATGRKNLLRMEIFGSEGALYFDLERLNELGFYSRSEPVGEQGFRTIIVTEANQPYVNAWWPPGHILGWEHTFIHEIRDLLVAIDRSEGVHPDFEDGLRCQLVLDAVVTSAREGKWVQVPEG